MITFLAFVGFIYAAALACPMRGFMGPLARCIAAFFAAALIQDVIGSWGLVAVAVAMAGAGIARRRAKAPAIAQLPAPQPHGPHTTRCAGRSSPCKL